MEKELYKALALVLLEGRTDQYGNKIGSPLTNAMSQWGEKNKDIIAEIIIKNIGVEKIADLVSTKFQDIISSKLGSFYDREKYLTKLDEMVLNKLADLLAKEQLEKIKNKII
jgi:hypothetical protein